MTMARILRVTALRELVCDSLLSTMSDLELGSGFSLCTHLFAKTTTESQRTQRGHKEEFQTKDTTRFRLQAFAQLDFNQRFVSGSIYGTVDYPFG